MRIMIMQSNGALANLWSDHLHRVGLEAECVAESHEALATLSTEDFPVIVLDVGQSGVMAVADYCSYRWPNSRVVFVTSSSFFSDGSIFSHFTNACAFVPQTTHPDDLAHMITYYAAG